MRRVLLTVVAMVVGIAIGVVLAKTLAPAQAQAKPGFGFATVPGEKGGQDITGPYEVVPDWPKPLTSLPGHEKWTWGAVEGIFAQNPNRGFIVQRGELPALTRPKNTPIPNFAPSLSFPVNEAPFRNASQGPVRALPGEGGGDVVCGNPQALPCPGWEGKEGVDARWEHCMIVVDAQGNIVEDWSQWTSLSRRPHAVYINAYDPEKRVWVVDDARNAIFVFSNDGKKLLRTLGTPNEPGADDKHFNRPTFLAWLPDSTLFVADGYNGTRVAKFDKDGKFLLDWGIKGTPPDTRPGYLNVVHGIAADPVTRRVYVSDRGNRRMQVFDENGKFLDQWPFAQPSSVNFLYISADRQLWAFDDTTSKIVRFDMQGHLLYAWGALGDYPGGLFNIHGASVDQEGNLYIAEVAKGRVQKLKPRAGANPEFVVGKPV